MEKTQAVSLILKVVLVAALYLLIVKPFITTYWDMKYKNGLNEAVNGCLKAATLSFTENGTNTTHTEPINDWYERCMKDKGY
jgi:hypothetical protein